MVARQRGLARRAIGIVSYGLLLEGIGPQSTLLILAAVNVLPPLLLWLAPLQRDLKRIDPRQPV